MYRSLGRACAIAVVSLLCVMRAQAQVPTIWTSIGPTGGAINAVLADPSNPMMLYVATQNNGVYSSGDAGMSWTQQNFGLLPTVSDGLRTVYALATDGSFIFAGTQSGIYSTPKGGAPAGGLLNWTLVNPGTTPLATLPVTSLLFDASSGFLFAASAASPIVAGTTNGVYVTATPGTSPNWAFSAFPASATPQSLTVVPTLSGMTTGVDLFVGSDSGFWVSPFTSASTALTFVAGPTSGMTTAVSVTAMHSADFFQTYACGDGVLYYTGDPFGSAPWLQATITPAPTMPFAGCNAFLSFGGSAPEVIVGTDQGAFFTTTDPTHFGAVNTLPVVPNVNALFYLSGSNTLLVGSAYGLYSRDPTTLAISQSWTPLAGAAAVNQSNANARLNNAPVVDTAVIGTTLFAATNSSSYLSQGALVADASAYAEVFASTDGGATWAATGLAPSLRNAGGVNVLAADAAHSVLYAGTDAGLFAYVGGSWVSVPTSLYSTVNALAIGASNLYIGADTGLFFSPLSATPATMQINITTTTNRVSALTIANGILYEGTFDATAGLNGSSFVFSMTDAATPGAPSQYGSTSLGSFSVRSLVYANPNLLAATHGHLVQFASSATASWASADSGAGAVNDPNLWANALYTDGANIYAATGSNGVFVSPVGTAFAWAQIDGVAPTALPSEVIHSLRGSGTTLYVGTSAGIATLGGLTPPAAGGGSGGGTGGGSGGGSTGGGSSGGGADLALLLLGLAALAIAAGQRQGRRPTR